MQERLRPTLGGGENYRQQVKKERSGREREPFRSLGDTREELGPQLSRLSSIVREMPADQRGDRVIVEATLFSDYIANSHYPAQVLNAGDLRFVGTRARPSAETGEPTKSLLLAATPESMSMVSNALFEGSRETGTQRQLRKIESFGIAGSRIVERVNIDAALRDGDGRIAVDAVLHPPVDRSGRRTPAAARTVVGRFGEWVGRSRGSMLGDYIRVLGGLFFVPILIPDDECDEVSKFNGLRTLRELTGVSSGPDGPEYRELMEGIDPTPPSSKQPTTGVRICVFDGPVEHDHPYLDGFVTVDDRAGVGTVGAPLADHGTAVASAALYGPLERAAQLPMPPAAVDHVVIRPKPDDPVHMPWAINQITQYVREHKPRIVNISVAPAHEVDDDDEPHDWTITLDQLAHELDVLFLVAVGNSRPARRIFVPADMVNGLAVGACDQRSPLAPWARAEYSHVGPGRAGARIRPSGVMFGGTNATPFMAAKPGEKTVGKLGTSFSAPTVARALAGLSAELGERSSATTLRAFAVHFSEPHDDAHSDEVGHGRFPEDFGPHLECPENEVTVLYRDVLARDEVVSVPVPAPLVLAPGTYSLRWTLAYASPVSPEDAFEYTQAGIELSFRPHALKTTMREPSTRRTKTVHLEKDAALIRELQKAGWELRGSPSTKPLAPERHERERRNDGGKWESVVRGGLNMRASSIYRPQIWLDYLSRDGGDISRGSGIPDLPFSLIVSIAGPPGCNIYDDVRSELTLLTSAVASVPIEIVATTETQD